MAFDKHKAMSLAITYAQQGKWDKAISEYQGILKADPKSIAIYNTLGDIYLKLGNKEEAVKQYTLLGEAYSKDGLYAKAVALYKKIQNVNPQDYKVYMNLGELYSLQGLMGEAKAQYLAAANYLTKTKQVKEALEVYQKIADLDPTSFTVRVKIGEMYLQEKMVPQAVDQFLRVALGYLDSGQREEARPYLVKVVQLDPKNLEARKILGQIYMERGESKEAAEVLESAAAAAPEDIGLLAALGELYFQTQQKEKAREIMEKVLSQDPAHQAAHQTLGKLLLAENNFDVAFVHLDPAAKALAQSGQLEKAQELYREIINQNPRYPRAREGLAAVLIQGGQPEKAISEYKIIAGLHREAQRNAEAADFYGKILEIKPDDIVAQKGLEALKEAPAPAAESAAPAEEPPTTIGLVEEIQGLSDELGLPSLEEIPLSMEEEKLPAEPEAKGKLKPALEGEIEEEAITFKLEAPVETPVMESKEPISIEGIELVPPVGTLESPLEEEVALEEEVPEFAEEDPVIAEHLIEADVYLKYGLTDRAVDLLRDLIDKNPRSIASRAKLKKIYQDKGQKDLVVKEALSLAESFAQKGELQLAEEELKTALAIEPDNSIVLLRLKTLREKPGAAAAPPAAAKAGPPAAPAKTPAVSKQVTAEKMPITEEAGAEMVETLEGVPLELLEPEEIPQELLEKQKLGEKIELLAAGPEEIEVSLEPAEAVKEKAPAVSLGEELALARFYRQQGLIEEAQEILHRILEENPQQTEALQELAALEQAPAAAAAEQVEVISVEAEETVTPLEITLPEPVAPSAPSLEPEMAEVPIPEIPLPSFQMPAETLQAPPAAAEITPRFKVTPPVTEAEVGGFVDIGAELEEEMVEKATALPDTKARSLTMDEIFHEFKKGVQQQLSPEDFETHYNLGIAYKEMGLLDEAISEFQLSAKGPNRFLDSSSMLGMCFIEKGMPDLAIRQYQKVLSGSDLKEEETLSIRYDLGFAYEKVGNWQKALECYMQVYGLDAKFRNVASKISAVKSKLAQGGPGSEGQGEKPPSPPTKEPPAPETPKTPPSGNKKKVSYV